MTVVWVSKNEVEERRKWLREEGFELALAMESKGVEYYVKRISTESGSIFFDIVMLANIPPWDDSRAALLGGKYEYEVIVPSELIEILCKEVRA